jgi:hypothetical protein
VRACREKADKKIWTQGRLIGSAQRTSWQRRKRICRRGRCILRALGLTVEIEKRVEGARGAHSLDVWVTGKIQSFNVRWVVECKDWRCNIPKEKVLALQAIAQDIGADRAFLLSETGFQAGAIRCARLTNITLTSLMDLREQTREQFAQATLWSLYIRVSQVIDDLANEPVRISLAGPATGCLYANPEIDENIRQLKRLEKALLDSFRGRLPVRYGFTEAGFPLLVHTLGELIEVTQGLLIGAEQMLSNLRSEYPDR